MAKKAYDLLFKLLLIGDSGVGKTCILFRFSDDAFNTTFISTIGIDFKIKTLDIKGKKIKLQIWDTAGQERFYTITTSYYRGAMGIMLVYDITNPKSFDNIAKWLRNIDEHANEDVEKMILGNKCDMEDKRMISKERGEAIAREHGIRFLETSAKANINIERAFRELAESILNKNCDLAITSEVHPVDQGQANVAYHFKILVPSIAAGAIIGKGGETIAQLQKEAGARIKMSKATDFYPGTTERVCLITGSIEGILRIHEFIMVKIKEKPDPNAKMAIDFDRKQPAEREKQVKILVPNSTAGMIIGKSGSYIKQIKEESGAYVQISQKSVDHALAERCITVIGEMESNKIACRMILSKIVEDPQSGSCLNVSYADVTGPVANFKPTGSPYANPDSLSSSTVSKSNTCSSNGSLSSLSPSIATNFPNPPTGATYPGIMQVSSMSGLAAPAPTSGYGQVIENVKTMLRGSGYSETAISEISTAMNTLASYRILGLGLGMSNPCDGSSISSLGVDISNAATGGCPMPSGGMTNQVMYTSTDLSEMGNNSYVATSSPMQASSNDNFDTGMTPISFEHTFNMSASHPNGHFPMHAEAPMYESFHRASPLSSPSTDALPMNDNSFGLGTAFVSDLSMGKRPNLSDPFENMATKVEIEVDENIVGAILGPGGRALTEIQRFSGANIQISKKGIFAPGTRNRIVSIAGLPKSVHTAKYLIEHQIAEEEAKRAQQSAITIFH